MTESEWLDANARYLSDALANLRERLQRCAPPQAGASAVAPSGAGERRPLLGFWHRRAGAGGASPNALPISPPASTPPASPRPPDDGLGTPNAPDAADATDGLDAQAHRLPSALELIAQRFGLGAFERDVLLLCAAMELDTSIAGLCATAQGDRALAYPTFALALHLFDHGGWDALSPDRALRYWRLVEIGAGNGTLLSSPLRADERIVNFIKGVTCVDDRLAPLVVPLTVPLTVPLAAPPAPAAAGAAPGQDAARDADLDALPVSQRAAVETIVAAASARENDGDSTVPTVWLLGADPAGKRAVAATAARALGLQAYRLDSAMLPAAPGELDAFARLWRRESVLLPVMLYIDAEQADGLQTIIDPLLSRIGGGVFVATRHLWPNVAQTPLAIEIDRPSASEQKAYWRAASPEIGAALADTLAEQFDLNPSAIGALAQRETAACAPAEPPLDQRLWDAARALTRPGLDLLARRIVSNALWDDLVLPAAQHELLHQIADQVRHRGTVYRDWGFAARMSRGLGISVLFAGATGTGKTMAAEVLANHLRLDLFRIDLSAVVSKYIGETEANLRRLFDAAEGGGAILFFDEADALFGKRTEVKDSHDRYANIEINYLLQRMESYRGLAVLATNMKAALDQAFLRRLRFIVDFPFPGAAEREQMWRRAFPSDTPLAGLDYARLARLNLTGGHIAVIAVNAAFQAARAGTAVTMPIVFNAARVEFRKLDRPVNETDFRWSEAAV